MEPNEEQVRQMTEKTIRNGGVLAHLYFDVHGTSKEAIKNALVEFIARMSKEPGVVYAVGEIKETIEEEGEFSTSAEVKTLTKDFTVLSGIFARYSPIGVEILEPHDIKLTVGEAQNLLLSISETSQEFANYVVKKVLKGKELEDLNAKLHKRAELGKKLLDGGKGEVQS